MRDNFHSELDQEINFSFWTAKRFASINFYERMKNNGIGELFLLSQGWLSFNRRAKAIYAIVITNILL